jgi:hypothetical protein
MKNTWFFLLVFFYQNDHFDQVLNHTSNQEGQNFKMVQDAHGLIKSTILNGHA